MPVKEQVRPTTGVLTATRYADFRTRLASSACALCPALSQERHTIVVDRGNPESSIMLVGEAPGQNEDESGRAFVGRAGRLLDKIMAFAGLDTEEDTLIVNVVKCRPPKNRAPSNEEAKNCRPFLEWQLAHVKPRVVILLGATAAKHFMPLEGGMKEQVGKFFSVAPYAETVFQLLYHPAYLLRDPRKKTVMAEHANRLRSRLLEMGFSLREPTTSF